MADRCIAMFDHPEYISGEDIGDNPIIGRCHFCNGGLIVTEVDDHWPVSDQQIITTHQDTIAIYKEIHGLEDHYLNLRLETADYKTTMHYCWSCGWWRLLKRIRICAQKWQIWEMYFGCAASLKNLDLTDIDLPLTEVRDFMVRNYQKRLLVNPRLFEELVGSVFASMGFDVVVTGYANDGGIDMVLTGGDGMHIGVQVKRTRNAIKVEQIRAFVGALLLGDLPKGIFVTTSVFQSGAAKVCRRLAASGPAIELLDAAAFYDALKIAQIRDKSYVLPFTASKNNLPELSFYGWDMPMNSL